MKTREEQSKLLTKARNASYLLQLTPFIRMIALNGSVARGEDHEGSDIDFFIVAKPGRIWTVRAFSVLIMALVGLKRYEFKISGRVCLNLYQTDDHLQLSTKTKELARSHAYTVPFWQRKGLFKKFIQQNEWIHQFGKSFMNADYQTSKGDKVVSVLIAPWRFLSEFLFDLILNDWGEKALKKYQTRRILKDERTMKAQKGEIYLSDVELRFHPSKPKC